MKAPAIAAIAVVLAAGLGAYYYFGTDMGAQYGQQPSQAPQVAPANTLTGLQVATRINDYVATQRNADGFYHYSVNCLPEENCFNAPVYEMANTWPVYANVGMYKATGDSKYLDAAKRDADTMMSWCENNASYCVYVTYQIYDLYKATGDARYLDFVKNEADVISNVDNAIEFSNDSMLLSSAAIEFADLYGETKNSTYADWARADTDEAQSILLSYTIVFGNNGHDFRAFSCWPQLANARLYGETRDQKILENITAFMNDYNLQNNFLYLWFMTDIQPCIDLYQTMGDLTGNQSYYDTAHNMSQYVLTDFWDTKSNPKVSSSDAIKFSKDKSFETVTDSSYMVKLLSRMKDSRFEVS